MKCLIKYLNQEMKLLSSALSKYLLFSILYTFYSTSLASKDPFSGFIYFYFLVRVSFHSTGAPHSQQNSTTLFCETTMMMHSVERALFRLKNLFLLNFLSLPQNTLQEKPRCFYESNNKMKFHQYLSERRRRHTRKTNICRSLLNVSTKLDFMGRRLMNNNIKRLSTGGTILSK